MRLPLIYLPFCLLLMMLQLADAQLSRGGKPITSGTLKSTFQWINLDDVVLEDFLVEDQADALRGIKNRRIARGIPVSLNPERNGTWDWVSDGTRIWRLGIRGKGARALGIVFNRYFLEEGARLFLYDPMNKMVLGAYTRTNNKSSAVLPVSYLPGEEVIIQLEVPMDLNDYGELQIGTVRFAYLPVFQDNSLYDGYFGRSDTCNVDINCPEGDDWQLAKRSVVRLINDELCTGVLLNNTSEDGKPYLLTAAHCVFDRFSGEYQQTVFYFNYESPSCSGPDGDAQYSISGASLVATGDTSENSRDADSLDFALLELSVTPPDSFMPHYAGWNRSKLPAQYTISIHHPRGDVKKISKDYDPPETSYHEEDYLPDLVKYSHWRILQWDEATTEGGSSGSPLFDQDQRVVGNLTGGAANCVNPINDYYTKFDYAWDYYDAPAKQLKQWLDPTGTGAMALNGLGQEGPPIEPPPEPEDPPLNVYPNPARDELNIYVNLPDQGEAEIRIYQITGRLVQLSSPTLAGIHTMNVSHLTTGIYILSLKINHTITNHRFIIVR
jgi:V8-like Glu-specific endopeptidase